MVSWVRMFCPARYENGGAGSAGVSKDCGFCSATILTPLIDLNVDEVIWGSSESWWFSVDPWRFESQSNDHCWSVRNNELTFLWLLVTENFLETDWREILSFSIFKSKSLSGYVGTDLPLFGFATTMFLCEHSGLFTCTGTIGIHGIKSQKFLKTLQWIIPNQRSKSTIETIHLPCPRCFLRCAFRTFGARSKFEQRGPQPVCSQPLQWSLHTYRTLCT